MALVRDSSKIETNAQNVRSPSDKANKNEEKDKIDDISNRTVKFEDSKPALTHRNPSNKINYDFESILKKSQKSINFGSKNIGLMPFVAHSNT